MTKATDKPLNIHQRLLSVMKDVTYIQKEKKQGMNYSVVSHDKVTAKVRGPLVAAGITYYPVSLITRQNGNRTECEIVVRFTNADDPNDYIDVCAAGHGIDTQDKGPGKAQSYAMKYALLKVLGLETGDDPDLDQVTEHVPGYIARLGQAREDIATATTKLELDEVLVTYADEIRDATEAKDPLVKTVQSEWVKRMKAVNEQLENA